MAQTLALEQTDGKSPLTVRDLHFEILLMLTPITLLTAPAFPTLFFLAVTSNHPYLYETTSKSHKDFIHFIKTRLNLWVHYLFGSFSSTRNNCTKIKRSLQNSLVHRYIHGDFFKMQSFQKNINRTFFFCLYLIYFLLFIYAMP